MHKKILALSGAAVLLGATAGYPACCYFAAIGKDVNQPGQKAFVTWDATHHLETFTVQPTFEGNATEFGMVIPTPSRPHLQVMPRDFFKALAIFTILEPMDPSKFRCPSYPMMMKSAGSGVRRAEAMDAARPAVRVLEHGVVGNLDYKVLEADRADALYGWLKENHYHYGGDQATLDYYIRKKWNFTTMKIDPRQMKRSASGKYVGDITPTRFTFASIHPIYPLRITQLSVQTSTDALFYVMARKKMDLPDRWSYEPSFTSMWRQAMSWAIPEKMTRTERRWQPIIDKLSQNGMPSRRRWGGPVYGGGDGGTLEWAGTLTRGQLDYLNGERKFDRDAPPAEVTHLKVLQGHLKEGWYLTKFRKTFTRDEMTHDLQLEPARIAGQADDLDYTAILPTSPP